MKSSLLIILVFITGIFVGYSNIFPQNIDYNKLTDIILYILIFLVGLITSANSKFAEIFKKNNIKILLIPLVSIIGTWFGILLVSLFISQYTLGELLAIGSGFGYYSLSSVLIKEIKGEELATIALLSNILRESFTLLLTPIVVKKFGYIAPIATAGATSMDVTLPIIVKSAGVQYTFVSILNGTILTILVPIFVTIFLKI